jgi:hypothetical protein
MGSDLTAKDYREAGNRVDSCQALALKEMLATPYSNLRHLVMAQYIQVGPEEQLPESLEQVH